MFIDQNNAVDKEALRQFVLNKLTNLKDIAHRYIKSDQYHVFWSNLQNLIAETSDQDKKADYQKVESQIFELVAFIETWISTSVESSEGFDFFISVKAEEISSGDQPHDYFWALQIRHDQLVALIRVLEKLVDHIKRWLSMSPEEVLHDGVFLGMTTYSLEDQIYLEADNIHKQRQKVM